MRRSTIIIIVWGACLLVSMGFMVTSSSLWPRSKFLGFVVDDVGNETPNGLADAGHHHLDTIGHQDSKATTTPLNATTTTGITASSSSSSSVIITTSGSGLRRYLAWFLARCFVDVVNVTEWEWGDDKRTHFEDKKKTKLITRSQYCLGSPSREACTANDCWIRSGGNMQQHSSSGSRPRSVLHVHVVPSSHSIDAVQHLVAVMLLVEGDETLEGNNRSTATTKEDAGLLVGSVQKSIVIFHRRSAEAARIAAALDGVGMVASGGPLPRLEEESPPPSPSRKRRSNPFSQTESSWLKVMQGVANPRSSDVMFEEIVQEELSPTSWVDTRNKLQWLVRTVLQINLVDNDNDVDHESTMRRRRRRRSSIRRMWEADVPLFRRVNSWWDNSQRLLEIASSSFPTPTSPLLTNTTTTTTFEAWASSIQNSIRRRSNEVVPVSSHGDRSVESTFPISAELEHLVLNRHCVRRMGSPHYYYRDASAADEPLPSADDKESSLSPNKENEDRRNVNTTTTAADADLSSSSTPAVDLINEPFCALGTLQQREELYRTSYREDGGVVDLKSKNNNNGESRQGGDHHDGDGEDEDQRREYPSTMSSPPVRCGFAGVGGASSSSSSSDVSMIFEHVRARFAVREECVIVVVTMIVGCYDPLPRVYSEVPAGTCFVALLDDRTFQQLKNGTSPSSSPSATNRKKGSPTLPQQPRWELINLGDVDRTVRRWVRFPVKIVEMMKTLSPPRLFPLARRVVWMDGKAVLYNLPKLLRRSRYATMLGMRSYFHHPQSPTRGHFDIKMEFQATLDHVGKRLASSSSSSSPRVVVDRQVFESEVRRQYHQYDAEGAIERLYRMREVEDGSSSSSRRRRTKKLLMLDIAIFSVSPTDPCSLRAMCGWFNEVCYFNYRGQLSLHYVLERLRLLRHVAVDHNVHLHAHHHERIC